VSAADDDLPAGLDLRGQVALVTGSSSGIGAAIAVALARHGARVALNSSRSTAAGEELAARLPGSIYLRADISDETQAAALVDRVVDIYGRLDVLVNNAGVTVQIPHADIDRVTSDVWHRILGVNVVGTWNVTQRAVPHLRAGDGGSIVNITSLAGVRPTGSSIPYAASKAALNHLTRLLANALGPEIRVNAIAPGLIDTPWTEDWDVVRAAVAERAPLRRSGSATDVADACLLLLGSRYMTGQIVVVDGGLGLR